ncbi:tetratricopeptide repeat protein, partial [Candidatus Latescibacterota bacterium]
METSGSAEKLPGSTSRAGRLPRLRIAGLSAIEAYPNFGDAYYNLAQLYMEAQEYA